MTGRIIELSASRGSGLIASEDGLTIRFKAAAVTEYDAAGLAIGQPVTFEVGRGRSPEAQAICIQKKLLRGGKEGFSLRYMGFEQIGKIRLYKFDRLSQDDDRITFVVSGDQDLFLKHKVGIQEGPTLSLRLLTSVLDEKNRSEWPRLRCSLTDRDLIAYLASRPAAVARRPVKRTAPAAEALGTPSV